MTDKPRKPFKTFIEGEPNREIVENLPPTDVYKNPEDVPIPLQANIRLAAESGLTSSQLAVIYAIPQEWVEMFMRAVVYRGEGPQGPKN